MIRKLLATTALASIIATGAYAQDANSSANSQQPAATDAGSSSSSGQMSQNAGESGNYLQQIGSDQYLSSNLNGKSIYPSTSQDAKAIGEIQNFLIGKDGSVVAAVTNATVGDQNKVIAIPFKQISWSMDKDNEPRAVLSSGADSLANAPAFQTREEQASAAASTAGTNGSAATSASGGTAASSSNMASGSAASDANATGGNASNANMSASNNASGDYPTTVGSDQYLSQNIVGQSVYSGSGQDASSVGDINDLVIASSGKVDAGVVGVGGFLGIGEKDVAVPFDQLQMSRGQDNKIRISMNATKDQLKQAPTFSSDRSSSGDMASNDGSSAATGAATATGAAAGSAMNSAADNTQQAAGNAADNAQNAANNAQQAANDAADNAKQAANNAGDAAANMANNAGNAAGNAADNAQQAANNAADNAQQAAGNAADNAQLAANNAGNAMSNTGTTATGATAGAAAGTGMAAANSTSAPADATASTGGNSQSQQMTPVTDQSKLTADNLMGTTVYGPNDQTVGDIGDIALSKDGKVDAVIIDVGGFLGIGEKPVAVAMDNLQFMQDANGKLYLHTGFTQEQLNNAPEYNAETYAQNRDQMRLENPGQTSTSSNATSGSGNGSGQQPANN